MKRLFGVMLAVCMTFTCASAATVNEDNVQSVGTEQGENGKVVIQAENAYSCPSGMKTVFDANADSGEYTSYVNAAQDLEYIFKLNVIDAGEYIFKLKGAFSGTSSTFTLSVATSADNATYTDQANMTAASGQDDETNPVMTQSGEYKLTLDAGMIYFRLKTTPKYTYYLDSLSVTHSRSKAAARFIVGTTGATRIEAEAYDDVKSSSVYGKVAELVGTASGDKYYKQLAASGGSYSEADNYLDFYPYVEETGEYSINVSYAADFDTTARVMPLEISVDGTLIGTLLTKNRFSVEGMSLASEPVKATLEKGSRVLRLHNAYTNKVPVSVDYIELTPVSAQLFKSYANGTAVFNTSDGGEYAILAAYSENRLTAVNVSKLSASEETTLTIDTSGADDVRAFVWENLDELKPIEAHYNLIEE